MWQPRPLQAFDGRWRKSRDLRRLLCHKQCNTRQHFAIYIHTDTVCHRCVICSAAYSPLTASCENQPQVLFVEMLQQQSLAGISWFAAAPFASSVKLLLANLIFSRSSEASVLAGERGGGLEICNRRLNSCRGGGAPISWCVIEQCTGGGRHGSSYSPRGKSPK